MTTLAILTAARELLSDEARWTRTYMATNANGTPVAPRKRSAARWCCLGAITKYSSKRRLFEADYTPILIAENVLRGVIGYPITQFNDDPATTHADVLKAFDRAIEKARADG
jgi:hypothetical protein